MKTNTTNILLNPLPTGSSDVSCQDESEADSPKAKKKPKARTLDEWERLSAAS